MGFLSDLRNIAGLNNFEYAKTPKANAIPATEPRYVAPEFFSEGLQKAKDLKEGLGDRWSNLFDSAGRIIGKVIAGGEGAIEFVSAASLGDSTSAPGLGSGAAPVPSGAHNQDALIAPLWILGAIAVAFVVWRSR